ncbi:hypothetical protein FRB94_003044 [Tulasnella sp. JGI-2019a]|nr:hypothetical protein FRB94_003044 [Tulasnella sp. JGI-2019a]
MIGTLLEDICNHLLRVANRDYRTRSCRLMSKIHSLDAYILENSQNIDDYTKENLDRAREAADAALAAASADPPKFHRDILDAFTHAEACLHICTPREQPPYRGTTATDLRKAKGREQSYIDQKSKRPLDLTALSANLPATPNNASISEVSRISPVFREQSSQLMTTSCAVVVSVTPSTTPSAGPDSNNPAPIASITPTENDMAISSAVLPAATPGDTVGLSVTVAVFDSDMEHPQISRTYKFQRAEGRVSSLIFKVTDPEHPENALTPMHDHTRWYVRETSRHSHTQDGLAFRRLVPHQSLRDIPACNNICTVCVVQSDKPYMVLTTGRRSSGASPSTANPDKGIVVKDYLDLDLTEACTYYNSAHFEEYSITAEKKQKWRDLPRHQVEHYSADWLMLLPSDATVT